MPNQSVEAKASVEPQVDKYQAFHDSLDVTQFKTELDSLRQVENPNPEQIAQKERDIVGIIKKEMQGFKPCGPKIIEFLLQELDIKYLKLKDSHQISETLVIVTADDTLQRLDNQEVITNENIRNQNISNILALTKRSKPKGLVFWVGEDMKTIFKPPVLPPNYLGSVAELFYKNRRDEECIKVCRKLTSIFPKKDNTYHLMLGNSFMFKQRYQEAIDLAYEAIQSNPEHPGFYLILGNSLANKPESPSLKKAIWALEQFIEKAKSKKDWEDHISETEETIKDLKDVARINQARMIIQTQERENISYVRDNLAHLDPNYHYETPDVPIPPKKPKPSNTP